MLFSVKSILRRSLLLAGLAFAAQACDTMSGDVLPPDEQIDQAVDLNASLVVNGPVLLDLVQAARLTGPSTISIVKDPTRGRVEILNTALLLYTPNQDFTSGSDQVVYSVCADGHCDEGTIDYTYVNDETKCYSMAVPDMASGKPVDEYIFVDILKNDLLCDDTFDRNTVKIVNQPPAGEAKIIDGALFYYPAADYTGPVYIVYSVAGYTNPSTLYYGMATITVQPLALEAVNDVFDYGLGEYIALLEADPHTIVYAQVDIFGNDMIGDLAYNDLTVEIVEAPAHGTVIYEQNIGFFFRPADGYRRSDSFTYKICHGGQCSQATVNVNVASIQAMPEAFTYTYTQYQQFMDWYSGTIPLPYDNILANDSLPDGVTMNQVQVSTPQQPSNGSIEYVTFTSFTFTPNAQFAGHATFLYRICYDGECSETNVTLNISDWP